MPRAADRAEVVRAVTGLTPHPSGETVWVGIDGFGGAGKTALADALAAADHRVTVVHVDDFAGPRLAEWDWDRLRAQLADPLLAGRAARYQIWEWDRDVGGPWVEVAPGGVVVVEGVSATRDEVGLPWALRVWVEAPADVRRARALERDGPAMWPVWRDRWIPTEQAYAEIQWPRARADLVVDGTAAPNLGHWIPL